VTAAASQGERATAPDTELVWRVWLLPAHPLRGGFALAVCALTVVFAWSLSRSVLLGAVAGLVLIASLSQFLLPTHFALSGESVRVSNLLYRRTRRWSEFRGYARAGARLKLLTLPPGSRLDNYRGQLLLLPPGEAGEAVLAQVRARFAPAAEAATAGGGDA
jgi:hypothetical protein